MQRSELLNTAELRRRGWTDTMISKLLGEPDERRTIPPAFNVKFYSITRVAQIEQTQDFVRALLQAKQHRRAKLAVDQNAIVR